MTIDWLALLRVAGVTVSGAVAIVGLMSLANWFLTPVGDAETATTRRRVAGYAVVAVMALIVACGIALIVPYFH
ncbi:MAG: hypothetical protein LBH76_03150 [Propionibacteriaceae bacterium]|jgi:hypothetical protein|nr:hypothetical protein [Propionibacteriaceae bacterium]